MDIGKLVEDFAKWNLREIEVYRDLISTKDDKGIFPPYVPFVGKSYEESRILIYAKAQNTPVGDEGLKNTTADEKVRQLCDATRYQNVAIAPYNSGVIPSLVGMYLYAKEHIRMGGLDEIHNRLAVTNFYKFSLNKNGRDFNPENLGRVRDPMPYRELNGDLCEHELGFLKPRTILSFKGWHNSFLRAKGYNVVEISDPAFILYGGAGHFRKGGRCYEAADGVKDATARELAKSYCEKCGGRYRTMNKIDSVRIYLLKYYSDWQA
jgi:hypothetical protein